MMADINCDLGEGESLEKTRALMRWITSANIAAGGHAGSIEAIADSISAALEFGVHIGVHPGLPDRQNFGRSRAELNTKEFTDIVVSQIQTVQDAAKRAGAPLHHVKLHGALYHLTDSIPEFRQAYLELLQSHFSNLVVYARAGGPTHNLLESSGIEVWPEGFLDRGYLAEGGLTPRGQAGDILDLAQVEDRLQRIVQCKPIETTTGGSLEISALTWCIHSDSPHAVIVAEKARFYLRGRGR